MNVIPAIDLMGGRCVRLVQGKKENAITYEKSPLVLAGEYSAAGAQLLHVVDLDGAFTGSMANFEAIVQLARSHPVQVGGGIRSEERADALLDAGVKKIIVSTVLARDPALAARFKSKYRGRLIGSLDFRDGVVQIAGWNAVTALGFAELMEGLEEIIVTDVSRDGTLGGPNLGLLARVKAEFPGRVTCAGGVSSLEDIRALKRLGIDGVIAGRSLLDGEFSLAEAIACSRSE